MTKGKLQSPEVTLTQLSAQGEGLWTWTDLGHLSFTLLSGPYFTPYGPLRLKAERRRKSVCTSSSRQDSTHTWTHTQKL
jgi:hypothetical protein